MSEVSTLSPPFLALSCFQRYHEIAYFQRPKVFILFWELTDLLADYVHQRVMTYSYDLQIM